jgi:hypothetical protein
MTTATEASWATSVAMPAAASERTRAPTPAGNLSVGRSASRSRATGSSGVATSAATPAVVPAASASHAVAGTGRSMSWYPFPTAPNQKYAPITTRLDSTGASAGEANLRCACRMPYSTTARP